jgi:ABC-type proline/glycine betaine transport system permease subunit
LPQVVAGAVLVAGLAMTTDVVLGWVQRAFTPRGLKDRVPTGAEPSPVEDAVQPS